MNRIVGISTFLVILTLCMFAAAYGVPQLLSYQGRLTDAAGNAIADGAHSIRLIIWSDSTATLPADIIWDSGPMTVTSSKGLFTVLLGAPGQPVLSPNVFADSLRWLGITVGADPEMSPRTKLSSVPYAMAAQEAATAASAPGYLPLAGGTMTGTTLHDTASSRWLRNGQDRVVISPTGNGYGGSGAQISTYGEDNKEQIKLWGGGWGELLLHNASTSNPVTAYLSSNGFGPAAGSGTLQLMDSSGNGKISLDASYSGDASVVLPDSAIDSREILDEPGIAAAQSNSFTYLTTSTPTQILTVSITIPASGYVVVDGKFYGITESTLGSNTAYVRIDSIGGNGPQFPYATVFGAYAFSSTSPVFYPGSVYRVFFEPAAGTYSFQMDGGYSSTSTGADARVAYPMMKATYFPTSYGSVMTVANGSTGGQFQQAMAVPIGDATGNPTGQTAFQADLRELEVKAAKADAAAEKAERDLAEARMLQMRQQAGQASNK